MRDTDARPTLQQLRLIVMAMGAGVIIFGLIVILLVARERVNTDADLARPLLAALGALAVVEIVAYVVLRKLLMGSMRRRWLGQAVEDVPAEELTRGFQALTLIGAALAEGLSLFGLVVVLVTGTWPAIVATVAGLLALALAMPTRDKLNRFAANVTGQHWG